MTVIGSSGIIVYGSPMFGIAIPVVAFANYFFQRTYLPISRQLRILEIEAKWPLLSHFLETLDGLATIQALRWGADYARRNLEAVKVSQRPFYLLYKVQNWLNLVLDLITAGLAVTMICLGVATRFHANFIIGLALLSAAGRGTSVKTLSQHWTQLEFSMTVVEQVRAFEKGIASEDHIFNSQLKTMVVDFWRF